MKNLFRCVTERFIRAHWCCIGLTILRFHHVSDAPTLSEDLIDLSMLFKDAVLLAIKSDFKVLRGVFIY